MATLEKIRSKSVLLLVIIGLALLAFIIGDFFTSGRTLFGSGTTVAKVDGKAIDIQDFQNRVQQASQQMQQSGQKVDGAVLQQQVLSQMIQESLFNSEAEALGLTVTDAELTDALVGSGSQYVDMFVQQQYGLQSASQLLDVVTNPSKYNLDANTAAQFSALWKSLEDQMHQSLLQQKFTNLFIGTLQANDLDAQALYAEGANNKTVAFASKSYASLADDEYPVTDDDIRSEWAKHKELYRLNEPTRAISYIAVPIAPSQDDLVAAGQKVENALMALRNQPATEGINEMVDFIVDHQNAPAARITNRAVKAFADTASVGDAAAVSHIGNTYTLAKLIDRSVAVDSVNIDVAMVPGTRAQIDSIVDGLNNGSIEFASLAANGAQANENTWITLADAQFAELRDILGNSASGRFFTPDTAAVAVSGRIFRVNERKAPVKVYDLAVVTFTAEPSRATINSIDADLRAFLAQNNTASAFNDNAVSAGYTAVPMLVTPSTPLIANYDDTREAIVWALDAKKGAVSPIYGDETSGQFIAVALDDVYDGYIPATAPQIEPNLRAQALASKKGEALMAQTAGKANDMAGYAQLLGSEIDTTTVAFSQNNIARIGVRESDVAGAVANAQPGTLVGPVKANNAIVVLQVLDIDPIGRPFNLNESAGNFVRQRGGSALSQMIPAILMGTKKIDNRLSTFYRD